MVDEKDNGDEAVQQDEEVTAPPSRHDKTKKKKKRITWWQRLSQDEQRTAGAIKQLHLMVSLARACERSCLADCPELQAVALSLAPPTLHLNGDAGQDTLARLSGVVQWFTGHVKQDQHASDLAVTCSIDPEKSFDCASQQLLKALFSQRAGRAQRALILLATCRVSQSAHLALVRFPLDFSSSLASPPALPDFAVSRAGAGLHSSVREPASCDALAAHQGSVLPPSGSHTQAQDYREPGEIL